MARPAVIRRHMNQPPSADRSPTEAPLLDLSRPPVPGPHFLGRDADLDRLDAAWADPGIHVLTLVAFGGVGKSALVSHWLDRMAAVGWRRGGGGLRVSFFLPRGRGPVQSP